MLGDEISPLHGIIRQAGGPVKFGKAADVTTQTVFRWIHDGHIHQGKHLVLVCEFLGVQVSPIMRQLAGLPPLEQKKTAAA